MKAIGTFVAAAILGGVVVVASAPALAGSVDDKLENRIEARLKSRHLGSVNVNVDEGVATLRGEVGTAAEKKEAERLARIKGIKSIDNQVEVDVDRAEARAKDRADERKEQIEERADRQKQQIDERAERQKNAVEERSDRQKEQAERQAEGVKERVERPSDRPYVEERRTGPGTAIADSWITTKVKAKFMGEDLLDGSNIRVDTDRDGVVTLSGTVRSDAGRKRAVELTKATDGVRKVNDELKVDAR